MECPLCGKEYQGVEIPKSLWNNPTDEVCPPCISDRYDSDMAMHRAQRIRFHNELVTIDKVDFECDGYCMPGKYGNLNDLYIKVGGSDVYGLLDPYIEERIEKELLRRVKTGAVVKRCEQIEKELCDSTDPATLRLERSDLDGELDKLEEVAG